MNFIQGSKTTSLNIHKFLCKLKLNCNNNKAKLKTNKFKNNWINNSSKKLLFRIKMVLA